MRFLAYADSHHDEYTNGVTLADTIAVEDQITQHALANNIDHVVFAGDWFKATQPLQSVVKAAEASWKRRSDAGIYTIAMIGNHDRWTRSSRSGHAFKAVDVFSVDLKNIRAIDTVTHVVVQDVNFLFIPAGWERTDLSKFTNISKPLIVVFHALLSGSTSPFGHMHTGIHSDIIKMLSPTVVIGGDNHTPQRLDHILGCPSLYLGAPLQHTWGDREQKRGFWVIDVDHVGVKIEQVLSNAPIFKKICVQANSEIETIMEICGMLSDEKVILEVTLIGAHAGLVNQDAVLKALPNTIVQCRFIVDKTLEKISIGVSNIDRPEDKWCKYVSLGNTDVDQLNPLMLAEIGKQAILEARN